MEAVVPGGPLGASAETMSDGKRPPRGNVVPLPSAREAIESRKTHFVGMVMALASWTMLFASLFFAYAVLRMASDTWPPEGAARLPVALPAFNTLLLLASSVVLSLGASTRRERPGGLRRALHATIALGGLFLALQMVVWVPLWRNGFRLSSGVYGSLFYGLTVFHALHVLAGLVALAWLLRGAVDGRYVSSRQNPVRLTAMFWHFVDIVWVLMFVVVYVL
jgi:cytochrome c oxidase subunit III